MPEFHEDGSMTLQPGETVTFPTMAFDHRNNDQVEAFRRSPHRLSIRERAMHPMFTIKPANDEEEFYEAIACLSMAHFGT